MLISISLDLVEVSLNLARRLQVADGASPRKPGAEHGHDLAAAPGRLERLRLVEEGVALLRIGLDRPVVPGDRLVGPSELLALLRKPVEHESVAGFGGVEGEKPGEAVGVGCLHRVVATGDRRVLYSPMAWPCLHPTARILAILRGLARARVVACALAAAPLVLQLPGCSTAPPGTPVVDEDEAKLPPKPKSMRIVSAFGGVHRRAEIDAGIWYQSFGNRILFLDAQSGTRLAELELAPRGTTGPVSDFARRGNRLYAVLEDDEVIEVDITVVRSPLVLRRFGRAELGLVPRIVAIVDGEPYVGGEGGVIRLADAKAIGESLDEDGKPIPPVPPQAWLADRTVGCIIGAEGGPVACVGRRIVRVADGSYLGAANKLIPVPEQWGGGYGFLLQAAEGAQVGLMGPDFRERSSSALRGLVHAIRIFDDRFFAINDFEVATWKFEKDLGPDVSPGESVASGGYHLGTPLSVPVKGALDIAKVQRNRFAVSGTFGRALYRYLPEGDQPGDTFYWVERTPGRLDVSVTDRRRILAASREGSWMYLIGEEAELVTKPIASPDRPEFSVEAAWGTAKSNPERTEVTFYIGDRSQVVAPSGGGKVSTMALADGKVWIGHDRGIDVVGFDPLLKEIVVEDRLRLTGPMVALYPNRVGGGVSYVAQYSGFGIVRPVEDDDPPIVAKGCTDGSPAKPKRQAADASKEKSE